MVTYFIFASFYFYFFCTRLLLLFMSSPARKRKRKTGSANGDMYEQGCVESTFRASLGPRFAGVNVAIGNEVEEKGSRFKCMLAYPVPSREHANAALAMLRSHPSLAGATHKIAAFRAGDGADFADDDGEARGGSALRGALKKAKATSLVAVVARWYGGVNIGKSRFAHIRGRARSLLRALGHTEGQSMHDIAWKNAGSGRSLRSSAPTSSHRSHSDSSRSPEKRRRLRAALAAAAAERRRDGGSSIAISMPVKRASVKEPEVIEILSSSEEEGDRQNT